MIQDNDIPTIADLAFRFGTISRADLDRANEIQAQGGKSTSYSRILVNQKMATEYQVGLLKLIQDYHVIRKSGEQFGNIAVEKGFADQGQIQKALEYQRREFQRAKLKKRLGDILVENGTITAAQRDEIVAEQKLAESRAGTLVQNDEDLLESEDGKTETEKRIPIFDDQNEYLSSIKEDAAFVRRVKEKQLASMAEISAAETQQKRELEKKKPVSRIGDLLVAWEIITENQRQEILDRVRRTDPKRGESGSNQNVDVQVGKTGMIARVRIEEKNDPSVNIEDIKNALAEHRIEYGVLDDGLIQCYLDEGFSSFPVAGGEFPLEETEQEIQYGFETNKSEKEAQKVKKGESLAGLKTGAKQPKGKNVRGEIVKSRKAFPSQELLRPGAGVALSENREKVFAKKTGRPALSVEKRIYVHPVIHILEDASVRTGPLEEWADISVKGILTDAYPVKAGSVVAGEVRGTDLTALGDVNAAIGITGARIKTQGDVKAGYLRNCVIETFGNVTIDKEIIDSTIRIGGKVKAEKARILSSKISAKKGIHAGAIGSDVTDPCELMAGRDDLVVKETRRIDEQMQMEREKLEALKAERKEKKQQMEDAFEKMKELKKFHDRTEKKKKRIEETAARPSAEDTGSERIRKDLESKLASIISTLKKLNKEKKGFELEKKSMDGRIQKMEPAVENKLESLERDQLCLFTWRRKNPGKSEIVIQKTVKQETLFRGIWSAATALHECGPLLVKESVKEIAPAKRGGLTFRLMKGST